jgi:hypothetical protein
LVSRLTDSSGNYSFSGLASGGNYSVTPTKNAVNPGSGGITTVDVIATQRHAIGIAALPEGCRRDAADVNQDADIDTVDVIAIQRFYFGRSTGTGSVGKYQFRPANRTYSGLATNLTAENYEALVLGDVAPPYME